MNVSRQKLKAIALARQLHTQLFELIKMEYDISEMKEYAQYLDKRDEELVRKEHETTRRTKVLQDYLKEHDIDFEIIDPMSEAKF
jgi:arsenate reductase-like glutaredoxin family protein